MFSAVLEMAQLATRVQLPAGETVFGLILSLSLLPVTGSAQGEVYHEQHIL
jgi:hypothetical protein